MNPGKFKLGVLLGICLLTSWVIAQNRVRRAPTESRGDVPRWELNPGFKQDCFTFARLKYRSPYDLSSRAWWTDYPDADLNLSYRLHHHTSMQVDPNGKIVEFSGKDLFDYPFVIISGVGFMEINDEETTLLRNYLLNGGFLMVDDFWGEEQWAHFYRVIKRVLPDYEPFELPLDHPIFHCLFNIKEKPQIPNVNFAMRNRNTGITWEKPDGREVHIRGIQDDKQRLMVLICHNTDLGDGWEEESADPYYFTEFSEKKAYPLGINIVFYMMTH